MRHVRRRVEDNDTGNGFHVLVVGVRPHNFFVASLAYRVVRPTVSVGKGREQARGYSSCAKSISGHALTA